MLPPARLNVNDLIPGFLFLLGVIIIYGFSWRFYDWYMRRKTEV